MQILCNDGMNHLLRIQFCCLIIGLLMAAFSVQAQVQKPVDPALVPPVINTAPSAEYDPDRLDFNMTIGLERTPKGRLWACWVGGGDNEEAFFALTTSDDNGKTWSKPRVVIDPHDASLGESRRAIVGTLWTDPRGRLWLFFDQSMTFFDGRAGNWYTICDNPDSDKPTWSKPQRIWHGCSLNKPTVLANGDWLLVISLWNREKIIAMDPASPYREAYHELDSLRMANVFVSSDQGRTWKRRGGVRFPQPDYDESHIIERRDGTLWLTTRTAKGLWESYSNDKGKTWSEPQKSAIENTNARHFIRRLQSGRLLLVKHAKVDGKIARSHLTAYLSDDDGQTWQGGLLLDERNRVTYPDGVQAPDGTISISYDRGRKRSTGGEILMARFTEEDVLKGGFVTPNAKAKQVISQSLEARAEAKNEN